MVKIIRYIKRVSQISEYARFYMRRKIWDYLKQLEGTGSDRVFGWDDILGYYVDVPKNQANAAADKCVKDLENLLDATI